MSPIDQHGELYGVRPADFHDRVHRGPGRAPGEEDVVDEDDISPRYVERNVGAVDHGVFREEREIITVEGDVEHPRGGAFALDELDVIGEQLGDRDTPSLYADHDHVFGTLVLLDDLVGDPVYRSCHCAVIHNPCLLLHGTTPFE